MARRAYTIADIPLVVDDRMPPGTAALVSGNQMAAFRIAKPDPGRTRMAELPPLIQRFEADVTPLAERARKVAGAWLAFADALDPPAPEEALTPGPSEAMAMCAEAPPPPTWEVRLNHTSTNLGVRGETVTADWHGVRDGWLRFYRSNEDTPVATYRDDTVHSVRRAEAS